jgi:hypothetical protein
MPRATNQSLCHRRAGNPSDHTLSYRIELLVFGTAAGDFDHSASYQAARQKREGVAEFKMLLLEGASAS